MVTSSRFWVSLHRLSLILRMSHSFLVLHMWSNFGMYPGYCDCYGEPGFCHISSECLFYFCLVEINVVDLNCKLSWGGCSNLTSALLSSAGLLAACPEHARLKGQPEIWIECTYRIGDSSLWLSPFQHSPPTFQQLYPVILRARETVSFLLDFFFFLGEVHRTIN